MYTYSRTPIYSKYSTVVGDIVRSFRWEEPERGYYNYNNCLEIPADSSRAQYIRYIGIKRLR
jgi:hypothetical protein